MYVPGEKEAAEGELAVMGSLVGVVLRAEAVPSAEEVGQDMRDSEQRGGS